MHMNIAKRKLAEGRNVFGTFLCLNSPAVAEVLSTAGFDYLMVDMEHGLMDVDMASSMIMAMKNAEVTPFIRVEKNDDAIINRALSTGAHGIMVPMINTAGDARAAVAACKYPTQGVRGVGPGHMCMYGLELQQYLSDANDQVMVILQVEHIDAINNIDEITDVEGIDIIFIGPSDLASSMGLLGQPGHQDVINAIERVLEVCNRKGVKCGIQCYDSATSINRIKQGFSFINFSLDSRFLLTAAEQGLADIRAGL